MTQYDVEDDEPIEVERVEYLLSEVLSKKTVTYFFDGKKHGVDVASGLLHSLGIEHKVTPGLGMLVAPWTSLGILEDYFELVETHVTEPEDYSCSEIEEDE